MNWGFWEISKTTKRVLGHVRNKKNVGLLHDEGDDIVKGDAFLFMPLEEEGSYCLGHGKDKLI